MNVILFDDEYADHLLPLTFTRPVSELRVGILTLTEKWSKRLGTTVSYSTRDYLQKKYELRLEQDNLWVNGGCLPTQELIDRIVQLQPGESLRTDNDRIIASRTQSLDTPSKHAQVEADLITYPEDIFSKNGKEIETDFDLLTEGRTSKPLSGTNTIIGNGRIFIEESATVEGATLNATNGSIYVGEGAEIMEGSIVRGGLAMCSNSVLKLGSKIYGPTTIGPSSKVGGEVNNSVIIGYSNKGHDGFLGNSVLGEWCNLGADTNNSNLKNNYAEVRIWDYTERRFRRTGKQFCGLIMGDHSKCGINTMFNTGTVVGVSSNIFGSGFPRNYVPSFGWGGASGFSTYQLKKAFETAELVMQRRNKELNEVERDILQSIFETTSENRFWETK
ncbi:MAG: GlmU family protein [Bacteroidia bacterium]|nr:GlmU family protein [Bacteroidia bacterium]